MYSCTYNDDAKWTLIIATLGKEARDQRERVSFAVLEIAWLSYVDERYDFN